MQKREEWQRQREIIKNVIADVPDQIKEQFEEEELGYSENPLAEGSQKQLESQNSPEIEVSDLCSSHINNQDLE